MPQQSSRPPHTPAIFKYLSAHAAAYIATVWQTQHSEHPEFIDTLIISVSDGVQKAKTRTLRFSGDTLQQEGWPEVLPQIRTVINQLSRKFQQPVIWCRIEWVNQASRSTWGDFQQELKHYKRNYFRRGLAIAGKREPWLLMGEAELNAGACFYPGHKISHAQVYQPNFLAYFKARHGSSQLPEFTEALPVWTFNTAGVFIDITEATPVCHRLSTQARQWGRRELAPLTADTTAAYIAKSTAYLARQVGDNGRFIYGYFPCFNRRIATYNSLRHASSTYALIEGYEACLKQQLCNDAELADIKARIKRALDYLCKHLMQEQEDAAYVVDTGGLIKLGANAVAILAMCKYTEVMQQRHYLPLMHKLAQGILQMQEADGSFVHVLDAATLAVKEKSRIIYYDGEAAFALMRLYGLTKEQAWLDCVVRAFDYFIRANHARAHDHWLSYCSNELIKYKPERKYFEFAVNNIKGYVDFIRRRLTTFPTLLELSMAFHQVLLKLEAFPQYQDVLQGFDIDDFYQALHIRANYLLNGFFFPEVAMFFKAPHTILDGFFIRHHAFRVRIDDVEHYLSGLVAYQKLITAGKYPIFELPAPPQNSKADDGPHMLSPETKTNDSLQEKHCISTVVWGGDVNLGRRQHYFTARHGIENVLNIPVLKNADFTIVNLECVISVSGEQGRDKGEGGPYYYRARPEMVEILRLAGIDAVACANNHSGDYGSNALMEQGDILNTADIAHIGTGATREAAFAPIFHTLPNHMRIALFCVDATTKHYAVSAQQPGAAYLDLKNHQDWTDNFTPLFQDARKQADIILIAVHWGDNGRSTPDNDEIAVGHCLIDAGADAVLGASAHQLQGVEVYKGKPIIHDAGDLLFDAVNTHKDGGVFQLEISPRGIESLRMYPILVQSGKSIAVEKTQAIEACRRFAELCRAMKTPVKLLQDGSLHIALTPNSDTPAKIMPAASPAYVEKKSTKRLSFTRLSAEKRNDLVLDTLPKDAVIEPVVFGALQLTGVRTHPHFFNRRRMLWVESFWQIQTKVKENLRIQFRAVPTFPTTKMRAWGRGSDHDPCDWLIPTARWQPGKIYRDFYGLRPPYLKAWEDGTLQLQVRVLTDNKDYPFVSLPFTYTLSIDNS